MMKWIPVARRCCSALAAVRHRRPTISCRRWGRRAGSSGASTRQLWLEHVSVADYLAQSGVVYQTNDVQYVIAQNNLWASPLDQQLQQTLVTNLSSALPGWVVSSQPMSSDQDVLNVTISGFHGRFDGKAIVRGEWVLNRRGA